MAGRAWVAGGVHGKGPCMAGGTCVAGGYVWQGACMAGGMHGGRDGHCTDSTHPTGMHSCCEEVYFVLDAVAVVGH